MHAPHSQTSFDKTAAQDLERGPDHIAELIAALVAAGYAHERIL